MTTAQILVVDDEQNLRTLLEALLESAGYRVVLANGGEAALARAAAETPDLALVDLRMPGMDGLTLLEHLLRGLALGVQFPVAGRVVVGRI